MSGSGQYGHQVDGSTRARLSRDAHSARSLFVRKPRNKDQQHIANRQKTKKFLVKGRHVGQAIMWDVYALDSTPPTLVGANFHWQEEAIAFARDRTFGRIAVSFKGVRGLFRASGGVLSPDRAIEVPGAKRSTVRPAKGGGLIVE